MSPVMLTVAYPLLLMAAAAPAPADPIAEAANGLVIQIEDDKNPDTMLRSIRTRGCVTRVTGENRRWRIDWRKADAVMLEDTFVFVSVPPIQLAFVGDASKPDQAAKLVALAEAMRAALMRCRPGWTPPGQGA